MWRRPLRQTIALWLSRGRAGESRPSSLSQACAATAALDDARVCRRRPDLRSTSGRALKQRAAGPQAASAEGRLPDQISSMPTISQSLDVVQHRSQLIVGRSNIVRSAVADPSIIEVAQYSPNELAIIGLQVGTTTLTLWFDKSREPLIYLVNTVRDPSVDERRRTDFGKLERKLALLFPNSKVYLIPFSGKLVVKGQAHDAEEAATILQIIRGEVGASQRNAERTDRSGRRPIARLASRHRANRPIRRMMSIVNMLEIPGEFQVMLRVRIAELDRSQLRRMGVDLTHLLFDGRHWAPGGRGKSSASAGIFENGEINVGDQRPDGQRDGQNPVGAGAHRGQRPFRQLPLGRRIRGSQRSSASMASAGNRRRSTASARRCSSRRSCSTAT